MNHSDETLSRGDRHSWFFRISALFLAAMSILFLRLPLSSSLGYEYSVAIAFVLPLVVGPFVIHVLRRRSSDQQSFGEAFSRIIRSLFILLAIPLLLAVVSSVAVKNCSLPEGCEFYLLIPFVTSLWLMALAFFCHAITRRPLLLYFVLVVLTLAYALYTGYASPQIYSYNFLFGFFPGISYDEVLPVQPTLLLFRFVTLLAAAELFLIGEYRWNRDIGRDRPAPEKERGWKKIAVITTLVILLGATWLLRTQLGFETTGSSLRKALSSLIVTPHFYIYYQPGSLPEEDRWRVAAEHEFRYDQIARILRTEDRRRITSFIYPTAEVQFRLLGTKTTNIAKPWRREIHLTMDSWDRSLKHELVHAMAGEFGMPVIHAHYNIGLVEGLATAIDDAVGNRTLHQYAASIKTFHIVDDPGELLSPIGFATHASTVSYLLMGSFCRFLLDRYGVERFKELYRGQSPELVYRASFPDLISEWQETLDTVFVPESWQTHTRYLFQRPSIFAKTCGRKIAALNEDAYARLFAGDPAGAKQIFMQAYRLSNNSDSYGGLIRADFALRQYDSVSTLVGQCDSVEREALQPLFRFYGDTKWAVGDTAAAAGVYRRLLDYDLSDHFNESLLLRLIAMRDSVLAPSVQSVLIGQMPDSEKIRSLDSIERFRNVPLVRYLRARIWISAGEYDRARKDFDFVTPGWGNSLLDGLREESLGRVWFHLGVYQRARAHFWESLNACGTDADRRDIDDWIGKCEWYERHAQSYRNGGAR